MLLAELAGPSGVGKSAIYEVAVASGEITPNPIPTLGEALNGIPIGNKFSNLIERIVRTAKGPRIEERSSFLYRSLYKYFLAARSAGKPMLIDGGLVQRGLAVEQLNSEVTLEEFWQTMPMPNALFIVYADKNTILDRNKKRGGDHDRSWQVDMALAHFDRVYNAVKKRGIHTMFIDATKPKELNAYLILKALRELS